MNVVFCHIDRLTNFGLSLLFVVFFFVLIIRSHFKCLNLRTKFVRRLFSGCLLVGNEPKESDAVHRNERQACKQGAAQKSLGWGSSNTVIGMSHQFINLKAIVIKQTSFFWIAKFVPHRDVTRSHLNQNISVCVEISTFHRTATGIEIIPRHFLQEIICDFSFRNRNDSKCPV